MNRMLVLCLVAPLVLVCACTTAPPRYMQPVPAPGMHDLNKAALVTDPSDTRSDALAALLAPKANHELRVYTIPVGAGSCHLIECPGNTSPIVYDCGTTRRTENSLDDQELSGLFSRILDRYADELIVIVSHGDRDHYNLIDEALTSHTAKTIWLGGNKRDYYEDRRRYRRRYRRRDDRENEFIRWLQDQEGRGATVTVGLSALPPGYNNEAQPVPELQCGDATTYVMTVNNGDETNTRSLVLRIEYGEFSIILAGDAEQTTEEAAMNFPRVKTTVLTGSHHGATSHGSNHDTWAAKTQPAVTLFSAGNSHYHPKCGAMKRYRDSVKQGVSPHPIRCGKWRGQYTRTFWVDRAEYLTETNGIISVTTDGTEYTIRCSEQADCF